jgi:aminoglycoside phosphotransferase (APT) family kinase protein
MSTEQLADRLSAVLAPTLGPVTIEGLRALTGGASRATWAFDAVFETGKATGRRALILRTGPPDEINASMELEAHAQRAARKAGAPVPTVLLADNSPGALGNPFLICDAIAGETVVRRIERQLDDTGREVLLRQCAQALAAIHRADPTGIALSAEDQLASCRSQLDAMHDTTAIFEWAFRWLENHRPAAARAQLVHGDFRMGNLIVDGSGLAAVLDWELVHLGDGCEDLAWFCLRAWRFGAPIERGAGGLGTVETFLTAYEQATGAAVERERFNWWLLLGTLRWGIICRYQAERHLSGQTRSVELAAIGRRVSETEWDLLRLLDGPSAPPGEDERSAATRGEAGPSAPAVTGRRPTAAELVAAVTEFLDTDIRTATDGQVNFHARVAANALRIVERELRDASSRPATHALAGLGFADEAGLAAAIRAGELDDRPDAVGACLYTLVRHRLSIDHPGYDR